VYGTLELSFKDIQQRAKSNDSQRAEAAKSAMFLLAIGMLIVTFFCCFSTVFHFVFLLFLLPTQKFLQ